MSVLTPTGKCDELYMVISFKASAAYNIEDVVSVYNRRNNGSLLIPDNTPTCSSLFSDIAFHPYYFQYSYQITFVNSGDMCTNHNSLLWLSLLRLECLKDHMWEVHTSH